MFSHLISKNIHFIGIGGAGMAPLAKLCHDKGFHVTGSDLVYNSNSEKLSSLGIAVAIGHHPDNLPDVPYETLTVVYSSAVSTENQELQRAMSNDVKCIRRGEMLAEFAHLYNRTVAISGSHGKTTISAMLSHILNECNCQPGYLVGGKVNGWDYSADIGNSDIFICEVDESDGTHALISPFIGVIPNVEDDHSWSVGGAEQLFKNFSLFAFQSQTLIYVDNENASILFGNHPDSICYSEDYLQNDSLDTDNMTLTGAHQAMNANLAVHVASKLGVSIDAARHAVLTFPGVARRMSLHHQGDRLVLLEDYAHHPTEIKFALSALRERFPDYELCVVFQPHRYARLEKYFSQFRDELRKADSVVITPVFAAWTDKSKVSASDLAEQIGQKAEYCDLSWPKMAEYLLGSSESKRLLAILGAGDISELIVALKQALA